MVSIGFEDALQSGTKAELFCFQWEKEFSETSLLAVTFDIK